MSDQGKVFVTLPTEPGFTATIYNASDAEVIVSTDGRETIIAPSEQVTETRRTAMPCKGKGGRKGGRKK